MLYLHLQKTSGNQTRKDGDLIWEVFKLKVTWHFDNVTKVIDHVIVIVNCQ